MNIVKIVADAQDIFLTSRGKQQYLFEYLSQKIIAIISVSVIYLGHRGHFLTALVLPFLFRY
jgi:hypothetical protein